MSKRSNQNISNCSKQSEKMLLIYNIINGTSTRNHISGNESFLYPKVRVFLPLPSSFQWSLNFFLKHTQNKHNRIANNNTELYDKYR